VNPKKLEYIYKYSGVRGHERKTKCERGERVKERRARKSRIDR
jgi:hypothetical protein